MDKKAAPPADHARRIEDTLRRIRNGLKTYPDARDHEPIHIFLPEVLDARKP